MRSRASARLALTLACRLRRGRRRPPAPSVPAATSAPGSTADDVAVDLDSECARPSAAARSPQYVSDGTMALAVYDGATLLYVGNLFVTTPDRHSRRSTRNPARPRSRPGDCIKGNAGRHLHAERHHGAGPAHVRHHGVRRSPRRRGSAGKREAQGPRHRHAADVHRPHPLGRRALDDRRRRSQPGADDHAARRRRHRAVVRLADRLVQPDRDDRVRDPRRALGPDRAARATPTTTGRSRSRRRRAASSRSRRSRRASPPATNGSQTFNVTCTSGAAASSRSPRAPERTRTRPTPPGLTYYSSNYSNGTLSTRRFRCFGS